jgi:hypothetical protein
MVKKLLCAHVAALVFCSSGCVPGAAKTEPLTDRNQPKTPTWDPNPVGWWKFDEVSGRTAADSSGNGRNGLLKGELSFDENSVAGRRGKALSFDGRENNYVEITSYKGITGTHPRTVAAWIKTGDSGGEIVCWGGQDYGKMWKFGFVRGRVGVTPNGGYLYINEAIHDDKWHHVAVVVDPVELPNLHDDVKLYTDGAPAAIHDIGLLDLWPVDTASGLDVRIGRGFRGLVDDVRIYNRALWVEEIRALFKLEKGGSSAKAE